MYYAENFHNVNVINRIPLPVFESTSCNAAQTALNDYVLHTMRFYQEALKHSDRALAYLKQRNLLNLNTIEHFGLGFADRNLGKSLKQLRFIQQELVRGALQLSGLLKPSGHEFFHGAIVFPFLDEQSKVVGGYGRRISPRIRRSPVYHLHWLSEHATFFNVAALVKHQTIILCKNPIDAISLYGLGYLNVVALMGIRSFTQRHIEQLIQHQVNRVIIACEASYQRIQLKQLLEQTGLAVKVAKLPHGCDVNQCLKSVEHTQQLIQAINSASALH